MANNNIEKTKNITVDDVVKFAEFKVTLGHDGLGMAYARLPNHKIYAVESEEFRRWLAINIREMYGRVPLHQTITEAQRALNDQGCHKGGYWPIRLRSYRSQNNVIEINIADEDRNIIRIEPGHWSIIPGNEGREVFKTASGALPLCKPSDTPALFKLQRHLNFENEDDFFFYLIVISYYIYANQEYIISSFVGDPGSGKSVAATITNRLLDPTEQPLCTLPKSAQDMFLIASEVKVPIFDNLAPIKSQDMSDLFAVTITGGSYVTRKLFANREVVRFDICAPIITTSIHPIATKADVADRTVQFMFKRVDEVNRMPADTLQEKLDQDLPDIMAGLYDLVAETMQAMETMDYSGKAKPRIAGLGYWGWAAEGVMGLAEGTFMELFNRASRAASEGVVDHNPLLGTMLLLCESLPDGQEWKGTTTELLEQLRGIDPVNSRNKAFPRNGRSLGRHLGELNTSLSPYGYQIDRRKSQGIKYNIVSKKAA